MKRIILYLAFFIPVLAFSQNYLLPNEEEILKLKTENGKQLIIAIDATDKYLVYRYGTDDTIEFEFPKDLSTSWEKFQYSWYIRGGGIQNERLDLNYLYFNNGNYRYVVFQESSANYQETIYGIKVINRDTGKQTVIKADPSTVTGTLSKFRNMQLIKEGDELFE